LSVPFVSPSPLAVQVDRSSRIDPFLPQLRHPLRPLPCHGGREEGLRLYPLALRVYRVRSFSLFSLLPPISRQLADKICYFAPPPGRIGPSSPSGTPSRSSCPSTLNTSTRTTRWASSAMTEGRSTTTVTSGVYAYFSLYCRSCRVELIASVLDRL
jgi:hypothetical protein